MEERLQKIIASTGRCSRRKAELLIEQGLVTVNGETAHLGDRAELELDTIKVSGELLWQKEPAAFIAFYKPRGYLSAMSDDRGRRVVSELFSDIPYHVFPVGRLDMNSEGLLLLTNDGEFANRMLHPSFEKEKVYFVTISGPLEDIENRLAVSIEIDGRMTVPAEVKLLKAENDRGVVSVKIHEGRNRQIRRLCEAAGVKVLRLKRVAIGPVSLGNLKPGQWRYLTNNEIADISEIH